MQFADNFKVIPNIIQNIISGIKGMGKHLKNALGHVLKHVSSIISLHSIYNVLSASAQSWLSSMDTGAKQLSTNIEYMKLSMRKHISSNN